MNQVSKSFCSPPTDRTTRNDEDVDTALEDGLEADSDDSGSDREDYSSEEGEEEEEESE